MTEQEKRNTEAQRHSGTERKSLSLRAFVPLCLVFVFYLFLAIIITWPLVRVIGTHFGGYANGDAHEMTRHIWWFKYALQTGQPLFYQPLLAYPDGLEGVILWSNPLQFFPAWLLAFVLPLPAAYNVQALLNLALNGWAAYFLARHLTRHTPAALLAGVVFMASPAIQAHLAGGHGGLLVQWPLPLLAWALVRLREELPVASSQLPEDSSQLSVISSQSNAEEPKTENRKLKTRNSELGTRNFSLSTILFLVLLPLGHTLQLIYAGLPLVGLFALALLVERNWRALRRLIAAAAVAMLILLVFLLPVASATLGTPAYTDEGGSVTYSLDLLALVTPSFNHPVYGQWEYTHRVLGTNIVEGSAYVGMIVALLALVAVWKRRESRWWLLVALVGWVLALGPLLKLFDRPISFTTDSYETFITLPWALLQDLPIFNLARTPGRFNFLLALALAVLAGYGAASFRLPAFRKQLSVIGDPLSGSKTRNSEPGTRNFSLGTHVGCRKSSTKKTRICRGDSRIAPTKTFGTLHQYSVLSTFLLIALILLDYQSFWPLPVYSAKIPDAVAALAQRDDVRAVFDMPWDNVLAAKDALWLQTAHHKPMITGHVSRKTPVDPAKLTYLQGTLDAALLNEAGADVVIVHKQYDDTLAARVREQWGEPFYEDARLALYDVPTTPRATVHTSFPVISKTPVNLTNQVNLYTYVSLPGLAGLSARMEGENRTVSVLVDGQQIHSRLVEGIEDLYLYVPLPTPGYHTFTLGLDPPCPGSYPAALECDSVRLSGFNSNNWIPAAFDKPAAFDRGVTLRHSMISYIDAYPHNYPGIARLGINLNLWWQFDQPRTEQDIRFIKVLDKDGSQVFGVDETLGSHAAGSQWVETLWLDLPDDLRPGDYEVFVGWYSYPDLQRFSVLADSPRARDGLAYLGSVTVE